MDTRRSSSASTASQSPPGRGTSAPRRSLLRAGSSAQASPEGSTSVLSKSLHHAAGSPVRTASPGLGLILDRESYWTVTAEFGCVPALAYALEFNKETGEPIWWGGRFDSPLDVFEDLVEQLPAVLNNGSIERRVEVLPSLELFASLAQRTSLELEESKSTRRGHADNCPASRLSPEYDTRPIVVLQNDVERERAFALFAFIANAYVFWLSQNKPPADGDFIRLPANISVPLNRLANAVGRRPITDYACSVLNNWILKDPHGPFEMENLFVPRTFTGLEAERWFFAIHAVIEHHGGLALVNMLQAKETISEILMIRKLHGLGEGANKRAVALQRLMSHSKSFSVAQGGSSASSSSGGGEGGKSPDFAKIAAEKSKLVLKNLEQLAVSLDGIFATMKRLPDGCPADVFFDQIRPWVSSWPDPGVAYKTYCACSVESGKEEPVKLSGASGAQSSLLPGIDGFLGIAYGQKQNVDATPEVARTDLGAFIRQLKGFRYSMPPQHRDLVSRFESQGNISELIAALDEYILKNPPSSPDLETELNNLKMQYNNCIEVLTAFRKTHMDYAVKYIKTMASKRPDAGQSGVRGTGGSDYAKHLGQHITDTKKSLYVVKSGSSTPMTPGATPSGSLSPRIGMLSPSLGRPPRRQQSTSSQLNLSS